MHESNRTVADDARLYVAVGSGRFYVYELPRVGPLTTSVPVTGSDKKAPSTAAAQATARTLEHGSQRVQLG